MLRLPRNLHFNAHKLLRLPQSCTSMPTKCCACHEAALQGPQNAALQGPQNAALQGPQNAARREITAPSASLRIRVQQV